MTIEASGIQKIAPDVKLGTGVKIYDFVNLYGCEIGDNTQIGTFVEIQKGVKGGQNCKIQSHTFICEGVLIKDNVFISHLEISRTYARTHILVRGARHCAAPEVIDVIAPQRRTDCVFGLAGHAVLLRQAAPVMQDARWLHQQRTALAQAHGACPPASSRVYEEFSDAAASWAQPWRVIVKADVMTAGDKPRFVVTS